MTLFKPTEDDMDVFRHVRLHIGAPTNLEQRLDDSERHHIDLMRISDSRYPDATTWATVGLSAYTLNQVVSPETELRVEFIGACDSEWGSLYSAALSSCAFNIIKLGYGCTPGTVYPDVVRQYDDALTMKHMMFIPPFLWEPIPNMEREGRVVTWLQAIPISGGEFEIKKRKGEDALMAILEKCEVNVFDLDRPSVR